MLELVRALNGVEGTLLLAEAHLAKSFEKWWPELEEKIASIPESKAIDATPQRSQEDLLGEVLSLSRQQQRAVPRKSAPDTSWGELPEGRVANLAWAKAARILIVTALNRFPGAKLNDLVVVGDRVEIEWRTPSGNNLMTSVDETQLDQLAQRFLVVANDVVFSESQNGYEQSAGRKHMASGAP